MAEMLLSHWRHVFTEKPIDETLLSRWLEEENPSLPTDLGPNGWELNLSHVERSITSAMESSPGPDGIPYLAWKRILKLASPVLLEASKALQEPPCESRVSGDFNEGFLSCIPKKPTGIDERGPYFAAKDTRPLSVVNTDNRLIAGAYRFLFAPVAERFVSQVQKAFLPGRSMLTNIVDVDFESMRISLTCPKGALI
eukprot:2140173-Karenia_brevis.AAC.1